MKWDWIEATTTTAMDMVEVNAGRFSRCKVCKKRIDDSYVYCPSCGIYQKGGDWKRLLRGGFDVCPQCKQLTLRVVAQSEALSDDPHEGAIEEWRCSNPVCGYGEYMPWVKVMKDE